MIPVSNTSPLIFASKLPKILNLIRKTYERIIIPPEVYCESVNDALKSDDINILESGLIIKKLFDDGFIQIKELNENSLALKKSFTGLGEGEASAIALAIQEKIEYVLIDERKATIIAKNMGLKVKPISVLPVEAYLNGILEKDDALELLDELLANQYRLSARDYKRVMALLDE